jgi:hypothetical protein
MHPDPQVVLWPDYQEFYGWLCQEVDGLTDAELDFDSHDPAHEWMWWSIRRQVSHMAWDLLIVMYRRCHTFLWPDGNIPAPFRWEDHRLGSMQYDRVLDERLFWRLEDLLDKVKQRGRLGHPGRDHGASGHPAGDDEPTPWHPFLAACDPGAAPGCLGG